MTALFPYRLDRVMRRLSQRERGLPFGRAGEFDFDTAVYRADTRREYGEAASGRWGCWTARVHALVFVETTEGIRVISLRKANSREVRRYEQASQP